jgi:hypothetical protein
MEKLRLWLETLNVRGALVWVKDALLRVGSYFWVSIKECFSRKTTWAAIALVAVAFWTGGFWMGADKKREAYNAMEAAIGRMKAADKAASTVRGELAAANLRIKSLESDLDELRRTPSTAPAPAPPKPVARPKPKPVTPAPEPASAWSWFKN